MERNGWWRCRSVISPCWKAVSIGNDKWWLLICREWLIILSVLNEETWYCLPWYFFELTLHWSLVCRRWELASAVQRKLLVKRQLEDASKNTELGSVRLDGSLESVWQMGGLPSINTFSFFLCWLRVERWKRTPPRWDPICESQDDVNMDKCQNWEAAGDLGSPCNISMAEDHYTWNTIENPWKVKSTYFGGRMKKERERGGKY